MDRPLLNDENEHPGDEVLARHLGRAKPAWDAFNARLASELPDASLEWRFYRDGKSWLGKVVRKKKTLCWISVWHRAFRTTFYFMARDDREIERLSIAKGLKDAYGSQAAGGTLKPLTIEVTSSTQLDDVFTVLEYKSGRTLHSGARSRVR